jgi:KAP family P-loop domain
MKISGRFTAVPWREVTRNFFQKELLSILFWSSLGALAAALVRALISDHSFDQFLITTYLPPPKRFDEPARYVPFLLTGAAAVVIIVLIRLCRIVKRGIASWFLGVTSGLKFISFTSTVIVLSLMHYSIQRRLALDLAILAVALLCACVLRYLAIDRSYHIPTQDEIRVSVERKGSGSGGQATDEPITTWSEDTLGRAALVDTLTVKIFISKSPVIALFGDFGSGKTSALNLLHEHIQNKAVVISFSTWLPGSEETLTSYLMADIATECQKTYMVPGLRRSATRLANALAQSVPFLKGFSELLPATTQKDDIENLRAALRSLPKRVVVLLDELDRMEPEELRTLLKVIRGISELPNLSFVCAAERQTLVETIKGNLNDRSTLYFEKFFPVAIPIPKIGDSDLRNAGTDRLVRTFENREWFETDSEKDSFCQKINNVWDERIGPSCPTLRAIGLLANDVSVAAAPLRREVDPIDLVLVEVLRRFKPSVYEIIARNSVVLTGGDSWLRAGSYHSDEEKKALGERLVEDLTKATDGDSQLEYVKGILNEMFPKFAGIDGRKSRFLDSDRTKRDDENKRICRPEIFPAYFRYELPAPVYSSVDFAAFVRRFTEAPDDEHRRKVFTEELRSMEKGSVKRDDFLKKISDVIETAELGLARAWTHTAIVTANEVAYEGLFFALGEAGHVLRMVLRFAQRQPKSERSAFLSECIDEAADDTMAFKILTTLTDPKSDANLSVSFVQLYPAFIQRMRRRYGRDVDAASVDLSTSDPPSFNLWGMRDLSKYELQPDPDDRDIQHDFWKRYIGHNKGRLIRIFNEIFMPSGIYQTDPETFVENKMSVELIRKLFSELPDDFDQDEITLKYVNRLARFLRGDFKNGISIEQIDDAGRPPDENAGQQEFLS